MPSSPTSAPPLILITGAARRIGAALAQSLRAAGYTVWAHTRAEADLALAGAPQSLWQKVSEAMGKPAILIHNAAAFLRDDADDSSRAQNFAVNLEAPRILNQLFAHQESGTLITLLDGTLNDLPPALTSYKESAIARERDVCAMAAAYPHLHIYGLRLGYVLRGERQSEAHWQQCLERHQGGKPIRLESISAAVLACIDKQNPSGTILDLAQKEKP